MRMLAIESSGRTLSMALFEERRLQAEALKPAQMRQTESLAPLLKEILAGANWKASQLGAIAISLGPGSFTGLRTGLAFAKGLAFANKALLLGIPTLEAWALNEKTAEVWLQAGKGMVYRGKFIDGLASQAPDLLPLEDAQNQRDGTLKLLGNGQNSEAFLKAGVIGELALKRMARGERDEVSSLEPIYLRRPEAEILWEKLGRA
jgi:tRNA threonylcarbamoyladenosine biosynthesis protein TsaB